MGRREQDRPKDMVAEWRLTGPPSLLTGFAYGSRYPSIVFTVEGPPLAAVQRARIRSSLRSCLPEMTDRPAGDGGLEITDESWAATVEWLLTTMDLIQQAAGLPVHERGRILILQPPAARCCLPSCSRSLGPLLGMLETVLSLIPSLIDGSPSAAAAASLADLFGRLKSGGFAATNVPRFVRAAYDLGLPFQELPGQFFQYGQGKRGCWLDSSFTQNTPFIAAQLAKDKLLSAAMLRLSGLPAPDHRRVGTVQEAVIVAEKLGYPVVVKPADLDGGVGVAADLRTASEVAAAFERARAHSGRILVEQHVHGADYRLTVLGDEVIWAVERVPAGVTGDGKTSIAKLVDLANADPRRGDGRHSPLKRLVLDGEAIDLMVRDGVDASSTPAAGRFIRLRRTANIASGGMPVAVFDKVHPDNARLAVRAARALKLDLAGVDLLIPDIGRSWRETGAAICEVNGQPQLGGTTSAQVYPQILKRLVAGDGRVATVLVLGAGPESSLVRDLGAALQARGLAVGWSNEDGVRVNDEVLVDGEVPVAAAGEMLSLDSRVEAMVLGVTDGTLLLTGLPVPRFDYLVIAGPDLTSGPKGSMHEVLRMVLPACDGQIFMLGEQPGLTEEIASAQVVRVELPAEKAIDVLASELARVNAEHGTRP